jgi:Fe-S oxidoreductase
MDEARPNPRGEGGLEPPKRLPLATGDPAFFDPAALEQELRRTFEICQGCRRCFNLCEAFPTLFDAVDRNPDGGIGALRKADLGQVVAECYLCDLCFMTKCPYVPPHPFNLDFPHLMLRAKMQRYRDGQVPLRDRVLSGPDAIGRFFGIPIVAGTLNRLNRSPTFRRLAGRLTGIHDEATLPPFSAHSLSWYWKRRKPQGDCTVQPTPTTRGRIALFGTCYGRHYRPEIGLDLARVFEHNGIPVELVDGEVCCGMPKLEIGDRGSIGRLLERNLPLLLDAIDRGCDLTSPIPSCVLMFSRELPLLYPRDERVRQVARAFVDPFDYLMRRHAHGLLRTDFRQSLGKVAYHVPCHLRVQNIGLRTRDLLALVPGTQLEVIERCSGHDGTYAVRAESHAKAVKIGRPVVRRVAEFHPDHYASDCPMAQDQIHEGLGQDAPPPEHPFRLLAFAYGLEEDGR